MTVEQSSRDGSHDSQGADGLDRQQGQETHAHANLPVPGPAGDPTSHDPRYPVPDPGLEPHIPRLSDIDPKAGDRAERQVATFFGLVPVLAILFVVVYYAVPKTAFVDFGPLHANALHIGLGLTLGLAVLFIGIGAVQWARQLMADVEMVDERHSATSSAEDRKEILAVIDQGIDESAITRRKMVGRSLLGALGVLVVPLVVSLTDLGPVATKKVRAATLEKTLWGDAPPQGQQGIRLVNDVTFTPIKPEEIEIGQLVNAEPENLKELHGTEYNQAKAKSPIIIVRMNPKDITIPEGRQDWQVAGILAYSKICAHVGCPISLWEQQTHHLLCPCHQSTFDLGDAGVVVFGPAHRALPQLPITVDDEGYLIARSDFTVPVGPSYFERDSRNDYVKGES